MRGIKIAVCVASGILCVLVIAFAGYFWRALFPQQYDEQWAVTMADHIRTVPTSKQAPLVLILPGCGGQDARTENDRINRLSAAGFYVASIDSLAPRNYTGRDVCSGRALWGQERMVDIAAALEILHADPAVDTRNYALVGFSHGTWTGLELLSEAWEGPQPSAIVAYYPFCEFPNTLANNWSNKTVPLLSFLGSEDQTTRPAPCIALFNQAANAEIVEWEMYNGAVHSFDVHDRPDWSGHYNEEFAEDSWEKTLEFLTEHLK